MNKLRKWFSFLLVAVMLFAMGITASAAEETGTIRINNVVFGDVYNFYRILDIESYDAASSIKTVLSENNVQPDETITARSAYLEFQNAPAGYYYIDAPEGLADLMGTAAPNLTLTTKKEGPYLGGFGQNDGFGNFMESGLGVSPGSTNRLDAEIVLPDSSEAVTFQCYGVIPEKNDGNSHIKYTLFDSIEFVSITTGTGSTPLSESTYSVDVDDETGTLTIGINGSVAQPDYYNENKLLVSFNVGITEEKAMELIESMGHQQSGLQGVMKAKLNYGTEMSKESKEKEIFISIDSFSIIKTDESNNILNGAQFRLHGSDEEETILPVERIDDEGKFYRLLNENEVEEGFEGDVIEAGYAYIFDPNYDSIEKANWEFRIEEIQDLPVIIN